MLVYVGQLPDVDFRMQSVKSLECNSKLLTILSVSLFIHVLYCVG